MRVHVRQKGTGVCPLGMHKDIGQGEKVKLQMKIASPLGFRLGERSDCGFKNKRVARGERYTVKVR